MNGQKNGLSKRWYKTGELLEESNWKDDKQTGLYRWYFQSGRVYLECNYVNGQRNGLFKTFFDDGSLELFANYSNDARDKDWKYFDKTGKLLYILKYDLGKLLNPQVQDSIEASQSGTFKTREDNIPDPEKFKQNPEEYMNLMKPH
jgi:antitoxin component YwqK of YwqJK toxin-antitoxin module